MKLILDNSDAYYRIREYKAGQITINDQVYARSLIVTGSRLIDNWSPQSFSELKTEHWAPVLELRPDIVLLGTGLKFIMPKPLLLSPLYQHHIAVESMDTAAACRTFTALSSEGRAVLAALLIQ